MSEGRGRHTRGLRVSERNASYLSRASNNGVLTTLEPRVSSAADDDGASPRS